MIQGASNISNSTAVLLNINHSSIIFVENSYQEAQRSRWKDWLEQIYQRNFTFIKREHLMQVELNRLKYTVFGNVH